MASQKNGVEPAAIGVGLAVAALLLVVHQRRAARCTTFPNVYSKHGPIHLQPEIKKEAIELADLKVEEAYIAGAVLSKYDIQLYLADYFSSGCNWEDELTTDEGRAVWEAYGKIAQSAIDRSPTKDEEEG
jgi:hypothetical protein